LEELPNNISGRIVQAHIQRCGAQTLVKDAITSGHGTSDFCRGFPDDLSEMGVGRVEWVELVSILDKRGYGGLDREVPSSSDDVLSIRRIAQDAVRMTEITGIGPLLGFLCEGYGPGQGFGVVFCADGVVALEEGVDLGRGTADGGWVAIGEAMERGGGRGECAEGARGDEAGEKGEERKDEK